MSKATVFHTQNSGVFPIEQIHDVEVCRERLTNYKIIFCRTPTYVIRVRRNTASDTSESK